MQKKNNLQARPNRSRLVTLNESNKFQDIEHSKITYEEALERMTNISKMLKMLKKIGFFYSKPDQSTKCSFYGG